MRLRGGVPEGERSTTLHWHINFLLLSGATHSRQMWHEAAELARQIDPKRGYRSEELTTLYKKGKAWNAGERIEFNGKQYPSLYTPKNDHLINLFKITDDEQGQLKTIISKAESNKRTKLRDKIRDKERKGWKQSRGEYEDNSGIRNIVCILIVRSDSKSAVPRLSHPKSKSAVLQALVGLPWKGEIILTALVHQELKPV